SLRDTPCARTAAAAARVIFGLAFGAALVAAGATPAAAHTALKSSNPRDGARVSEPPGVVELTFTGPLRAQLSKITVRGPGGEEFQTGPAQVASGTARQSVRTLGAAGRYQIAYRVVAADGHPLVGTVRFTVTAAQPSPAATPGVWDTPTTQPGQGAEATPAVENQSAATADEGVSPWVLGTAAIALVACVGGALLFGRRVTRDLD
ncbi:MAG: copper resistance CopC family protein, partial [Actinomadura sp.]